MTTPTLFLTPTGPVSGTEVRGLVFPSPLRRSDYEVTALSGKEARPLIEQWHYAHGVGNVTAAYALRFKACGTAVAVAAFNPPSRGAAVLMAREVTTPERIIGLTRLCFHPEAPQNAGSFLLAAAMSALPERWDAVSTYADEGQGVCGTVYQASNFAYLGKTPPRPMWHKDGVQVSTQRGSRTLTHQQMLDEGCVIASRASLHRYRFVREYPESRNPQHYPKMMPSLWGKQ